MYAPQRDINYLMTLIASKVPLQVMEHRSPAIAKLCRDSGVTEKDLLKAVEAYSKFLQHLHEPEYGDRIHDALRAAGWDDCHEVAKVAVQAYMAMTLTFAVYKTIRDATRIDSPSVAPMRDLIYWTDEAVRYSQMNWFERFIYRIKRKFDTHVYHVEVPW